MDILRASIKDLQAMMSKGALASEELVDFYVTRISKLDSGRINSVGELSIHAASAAKELDYERKNGQIRSPLHGIPILVKDNIDTCDDLHTTGGTVALKDHRALKDAPIIQNLRSAGAIILGKTNMTELANFVSMDLPNGFSAGKGQVQNPFGDYEIGGSSSGSAAAVACGFAAAAIGTETSGSIVMPASMCSVVGFKPAVGHLRGSGIIPLAQSQDTAGPIAKYAGDIELLCDVMAFPNTFAAPPVFLSDSWNTGSKLSKLRIGVLSKSYEHRLGSDARMIVGHVLSLLSSSEVQLIPIGSEYFPPEDDRPEDLTVMLHEFKSGINDYLKNCTDCPVRSLSDLILFNEAHKDTAIPYGQDLLTASEKTSDLLTEPEYMSALAESIHIAKEKNIDAAMRAYRLDAIVSPSYYAFDFPARAGYPSMTVPVGFSSESGPVSLLLFGKSGSEKILLYLCRLIERILPPIALPSLKI